jgi:siroheme synthase-like protein
MSYTYMPVSLTMKGRRCLVVGGGKVALRKVETLLDYDTEITVIAPDMQEKLQYHGEKGRIKIEKREYRSPEASRYDMVISCIDEKKLNRKVYDDCKAAGVPINVADEPSLCDFIFPAVVRRDCLTASISTDGKAPFMSAHLSLILGTIFPEHWEKLMRHAAIFRKKVQERWSNDPEKKAACYGKFLDADWKSVLKKSSEEEIENMLNEMLEL